MEGGVGREVQEVAVRAVCSQAGGCQTCRWSVSRYSKLWCEHWDCPALGDCPEYEYEPGAAP